MAHNTAAMSNASEFRSVIQVDQDIAFVLDSRDIDFSAVVNNNKSIGISRKTYSKRHPIVFDATVPTPENKMNGSSNITARNRKAFLKISPKCSSTVQKTTKEFRRKRPLENDRDASNSPVPKRMKKKEIPNTRINGGIIDRSKHLRNSQSIRVPSPDSDIEILDVIEQSSSRATKRNSLYSFNGRERNREKLNDFERKRKSLPSILKPCYPSSDDVPISEADTAPVIPSNSVIPDTGKSETNQNVVNSQSVSRWMLSTGTFKVLPFQNGETSSAKDSEKSISDNDNLFCAETDEEAIEKKKRLPRRELKNLYANLNEIAWAKEKGFLQMLSNTDHRHSERITAKAVDTGKNLRRLKAGSGKKLSVLSNRQKKSSSKNSAKLVLNRAKYGRPKPKVVLKKTLKPKQSVNKMYKRPTTKLNAKPLKKVTVKSKNVPRKVIVKPKILVKDKRKQVSPPSSKTSKNTGNSATKTDKTLQHDNKNSLPSALKKLVASNSQVSPESSSKSKVMRKFEYSNEVKVFKKKVTDNKVYSKVKVEVKPLKHTTEMWNSNFCEAFSRYVMDQSSTQAGAKDKGSFKAIFEELLESWFNNQPDNPKLPKKKKPEEETLRSSVRQSECAFRYKEIVVKKHDNYMQFILVPNAIKQNSLSIEAMKELREAFILARKDPNCKAVLLNSSGTFFCTGIDLSQLIGSNKKQCAEEMASTIKDLVLTVSSFSKPVVAAVNGIAVGFGVTLLTMCDVVLASDKATFCIPATRLGYLPEGAITLTLPQVVGSTVATELLLYGRRLTADQALRHGLVSEVLWHSNLMNEVVPRMKVIVSQSLQVMEATKMMVRCHLWDNLKCHMEREWRLLPPLWLDAQCQSNIKKALQTGWLYD